MLRAHLIAAFSILAFGASARAGTADCPKYLTSVYHPVPVRRVMRDRIRAFVARTYATQPGHERLKTVIPSSEVYLVGSTYDLPVAVQQTDEPIEHPFFDPTEATLEKLPRTFSAPFVSLLHRLHRYEGQHLPEDLDSSWYRVAHSVQFGLRVAGREYQVIAAPDRNSRRIFPRDGVFASKKSRGLFREQRVRDGISIRWFVAGFHDLEDRLWTAQRDPDRIQALSSADDLRQYAGGKVLARLLSPSLEAEPLGRPHYGAYFLGEAFEGGPYLTDSVVRYSLIWNATRTQLLGYQARVRTTVFSQTESNRRSSSDGKTEVLEGVHAKTHDHVALFDAEGNRVDIWQPGSRSHLISGEVVARSDWARVQELEIDGSGGEVPYYSYGRSASPINDQPSIYRSRVFPANGVFARNWVDLARTAVASPENLFERWTRPDIGPEIHRDHRWARWGISAASDLARDELGVILAPNGRWAFNLRSSAIDLSTGRMTTSYGGGATSAAFAADAQSIYIAKRSAGATSARSAEIQKVDPIDGSRKWVARLPWIDRGEISRDIIDLTPFRPDHFIFTRRSRDRSSVRGTIDGVFYFDAIRGGFRQIDHSAGLWGISEWGIFTGSRTLPPRMFSYRFEDGVPVFAQASSSPGADERGSTYYRASESGDHFWRHDPSSTKIFLNRFRENGMRETVMEYSLDKFALRSDHSRKFAEFLGEGDWRTWRSSDLLSDGGSWLAHFDPRQGDCPMVTYFGPSGTPVVKHLLRELVAEAGPDPIGWPTAFTFSRDGRILAVGHGNGREGSYVTLVALRQTRDLRVIATYSVDVPAIRALRFSPDRTTLAVVGEGGETIQALTVRD